jgi:hypothetical protein
MKKFLLPVFLTLLLALLTSIPVQASDDEELSSSDQTAGVLCIPGVYLEDPGDCSPLGPSAYLTNLAREGIRLPVKPLALVSIDPALGYVPYQYARLLHQPTPVYASLADAVAGNSPSRYIEAGELSYISYVDMAETENGRFFLLKSGGWVQVETRVSIPRSYPGGVEFMHTPANAFGWILPFSSDNQPKRTPGYGLRDYTGRRFSPYEIIQVYGVERVGEVDWYRIGPDEWVEKRIVGAVFPNTTPPEGVENGRWIELNLFEQTLAVYENHELVFATLMASGADPFHTRPGLFPIYQKLVSTPMSGAFEADRSDYYYLEDVPWTLYYDEARAIHGAYWRSFMGYKQSHGCVNLVLADAHWIFKWAEEGDWVYVWDPSGETPEDPSLYTRGGA